MYTVKATAPTKQHTQTLSLFGRPIPEPGGAYHVEKQFKTEAKAQDFLEGIAHQIYDDALTLPREVYKEIYEEGRLTIYGVTAEIHAEIKIKTV